MNEPLLDGRYLLLEALGSGGEARVFRAHDNVVDLDVALRVPLRPVGWTAPDSMPAPVPEWVHFLGWGNDPEKGAYQIFEVLEGSTLSQTVASGPLDLAAWKVFVFESLNAVAALHESGWIHGDLNAENFVRARGANSGWKLLELPFLRFDPPAGRTALFGSIHTLAPEQLDGAAASIHSDLYALGCLYYYAACGEFPHAGASSRDIAIARLRFAATPLTEKAPGLPAALADGVMTLLASDPQKRLESAAAARQLLGIA